MANQWLRLWHDMPTDPKWRTIAKVSGQPISLVISVYIHLLVEASRNVTRGHADVTNEDLASALDSTEEAISSIFDAMQGRVLEENRLTGWNKRQVKVEDQGNPETGAKSAAQRKQEQRERENAAKLNRDVTPCHDKSRDVTIDKIREDTDKNVNKDTSTSKPSRPHSDLDIIKDIFEFWKDIMNSPRSVLDNKRKSQISKALKHHPPDDLKKAIRGCSKTPFNMGQNEQRTKYNGIDLIFRNSEKIEAFMRNDDQPPLNQQNGGIHAARERTLTELTGGRSDTSNQPIDIETRLIS